jgi:hypothetical protein
VKGGEPVVEEPAGPHGLQADTERLEGLGGHPLTFMYQAEQDVLGPDEVVVEEARLLLG